MNLEIVTVVIDFGLVVLIWMVQLLIYPSFRYFATKNLYLWHEHYTKFMAIIVLPLMASQLIISIINLINALNLISIVHFSLVLLTWLTTLLFFVPLHNRISNKTITNNTLSDLLVLNWLRVVLWTLILIISIFNLK